MELRTRYHAQLLPRSSPFLSLSWSMGTPTRVVRTAARRISPPAGLFLEYTGAVRSRRFPESLR